MKAILVLLSWITAFSAAFAVDVKVTPLSIGASAPDFSLPGIDDKTHTLAEYAKADVLMVAFISNHCPSSQGAESRIKKLVLEMKGKSFKLVAINPNHPDGLRPDELGYSKYNDGFDDMKKHAKEQGFNFDYLYDGETQSVAKAYGCLATPHVFVFDTERKLRYQGWFDDSRYDDDTTVKSTDGRNAVEALLASKPVPVETTKVHGCSTKWKEKRALVLKDEENWQTGTVEVEPITAAAVAELRKNATAKLRMINVWATWCSPCVEEFPELVKTQRKFALRDFELITISMDDKKDLAKVKQFLEEKNSILPDKLRKSLAAEKRKTNHYLYAEDSQEDLIRALDPEWQGPIPYTLILGPGGEVIKRVAGPIENGDDLRQMLLDYMGRGYVAPSEQKPKSSADASIYAPNKVFKMAVEAFMSAKISNSLEYFDRLIQLDARAKPALWQRGVALYYADQFAEGREQFEVHQSVNSEDVENAAWHFLCVARDKGLAEAKQCLISIKGDSRVPMKEVFQLFSGQGTEEQVLKAAEQGDAGAKKNQLCYAHLYLGLYAEACGDKDRAKQHITLAARDYAMNHYMGEVARVHLKVRGW